MIPTSSLPVFLTALLVSVPAVTAQLPYNPNNLILNSDGSQVLQFSVQASEPTLSYLNISRGASASSVPQSISANLPISSTTSQAYLAIAQSDGISLLVGDCQDTTTPAQIWRIDLSNSKTSGTWTQVDISKSDTVLSANYLAAGFSFSPSALVNDTGLYLFGGMCPNGASNSSDWTSQADYSNSISSVVPEDTQTSYDLTTTEAPPIAEAGLTITPLSPTNSTSSNGQASQQQNFVLLGGHTQTAFINMSQVAVYSLPEGAWAFVGVDQPDATQGELVKRDASTVEPRSGHTAVLSEDGTKVVVFGGWVGDVTNPASPQLAILNIGQDYGGTGQWSWSIPTQTANPFSSGQGVFGHGAVMLPGGVMMVSGGTNIGQTMSKRATTQNYMFYNTTSSTWISTYQNPNSTTSSKAAHSGGLNASQKAGLGAGLSLGLVALAVVAIFWFVYARRLKAKRVEREKRLRELALGSGRYQSYPNLPSGVDGRGGYPEMRSTSWGSNQERQIQGRGDAFPWAPVVSMSQAEALNLESNHDDRYSDGTNLRIDVASPHTGLRRSLHSRGPAGFGNHFSASAAAGPGSVFRIDEEEEGSVNSLRARTPVSRLSDPFKDPPKLEPRDVAAEERKKEVKGWVDDWQSAAESMSLSRNPSQGRTYSNLSQAHSVSNSSSDRTGRVSPDKSDRTGSNLSERSNISGISMQRSVAGTVSRTLSQRSVSAGYALFAGAAAAMGKLATGQKETQLDRSASKRSISLNSAQVRSSRPISADSQALLREHSPMKSEANGYWTPPESPIRDYKNYARTSSLTSQGRTRARSVLGSFKRVLTGTSQVDVQAQVEHYEEVEKVVDSEQHPPEMSETRPRRASNTGFPFLQGKRGARDWNEEDAHGTASSSTVRRRSGGRTKEDFSVDEYDGEDWDVETAVQKRVVQVMFTMPKEKLRVVNADALSLISRSDTGGDDVPDADIKRMSSVREGEGEDEEPANKGKGKEVER